MQVRYDDPKLFLSLMENFPDFRHTIPVSYNKKELGELTIDFKASEQGKTDAAIKSYQELIALELFNRTTRYLREDLETVVKFEQRMKKPIPSLSNLLPFYLTEDEYFLWKFFHYPPDKDIFEIIDENGPIALCNSSVQERLTGWLADKAKAPIQLKKLVESLLKYGKIRTDYPIDPGRLEKDITRIFGTEWIAEIYSDIRLILNAVRKKEHLLDKDKAHRLIDEEFRKHMKMKLEKYEADTGSKGKWIQLLGAWESYEHLEMPNPIAELITKDDDLWISFTPPGVAAYLLAKEVLAKMFDVSFDKIVSAISRKKK